MGVDSTTLKKTVADCLPAAQAFVLGTLGCPSVHGKDAGVQEITERLWTEAGFEVERHEMPDGLRDDPEYGAPAEECGFAGRPNLVVRDKAARAGRTVILCSHMDVVPADDWDEAFTPRVDGDTITARGACDAKGNVAVMFLAALAMKKLSLPGAGEVIHEIVIDEEVGGNGALALIREGITADAVVVCEPTELHMHAANRGALWFRFTFEGKSCHMGRKYEGINAVDLAAETIRILYEYEKELVNDQETQPLFAQYKFPAQVNIGTLMAPGFPSMVAGRAVMEGGIGFLPNRAMAQVKKDVEAYIDRLGSDTLKARYTVEYPKLHNDSFETPVDHPLVRTFHEATTETDAADDVTGWIVSCDARLFAKAAGLPTIVFGAGSLADAHSKHEQINLADVAVAAETIVRFVEKWCV